MSMRTLTYELELKDDRTVTLTLPEDIPLGKHQIVVVIDEYIKNDGMTHDRYDELLLQTRGLWKQGDGLRYQEKIRDEWNRPS
jgi:hypothetical protein